MMAMHDARCILRIELGELPRGIDALAFISPLILPTLTFVLASGDCKRTSCRILRIESKQKSDDVVKCPKKKDDN